MYGVDLTNDCHHRAGTVDVPFDKTRNPGSGAWLGYPPRSTRTELSDPRPPGASYRCIAGHRIRSSPAGNESVYCRIGSLSRGSRSCWSINIGSVQQDIENPTAIAVPTSFRSANASHMPSAGIMAHAIKTPIASTDAPVQLTRATPWTFSTTLMAIAKFFLE